MGPHGPTRTRLAALTAVLLAAALAGTAQERASPVFPVDLDVVNVTVTVVDRNGYLVSDLAAEDFAVYEDGRPQRISVFARSADTDDPAEARARLALDLGLLLDTSESMLKELKLSQEAATRFLETVPRARELFVVFFDEEIRISRYDSENQQGLYNRIHALKGGGNTALYDAIAAYLSRVHGDAGRKVLVLFSDGEDSRSTLGLPDVLRLLRASPVTIYAIAFSGGFPSGSSRAVKARGFLQHVVEMTGGRIFPVSSSRELASIYRKILDELSRQYVIGFTSDNTKRDGRFRKLRVEVTRKGLATRHRPGYVAEPASAAAP